MELVCGLNLVMFLSWLCLKEESVLCKWVFFCEVLIYSMWWC